MNQQTRHKPAASKLSLLRRLCNLIPNHLVPQLARATDSEWPAVKFKTKRAITLAEHQQIIAAEVT